jgi:Mg-chelatase subunit ChlD
MGGPVWPPSPEQGDVETIEEYGDLARAVIAGAESDEDAEAALLSHFLYAAPPAELQGFEDAGTTLDSLLGQLHPWLRMVSGMDFGIAYGQPAGTDGEHLYLPRALPQPENKRTDLRFFRCAALVQLGLIRFGLLSRRGVLAELHSDWMLRGIWQLLATRYIVRIWSADWPGIAADFRELQECPRATEMRVGHQPVPKQGMPEAFRPLYTGLVSGMAPAGPAGDLAKAAIEAVDSIASRAAAPLVLLGHAQHLRQHFFALRLGPPPLPAMAGLLRPAWIMEDLAADMRAASEWKQGSKPLQPLLRAMRKGGLRGAVAGKLKERLVGANPAPNPDQVFVDDYRPLHRKDEGDRYDEWDSTRGVMRVRFTRVLTEDAQSGPLSAYTRIAETNAGEIARIRRAFAALRIEERWHHGQPDGSDIDLDRCIAAMVDVQAGFTPRTNWYKRFTHEARPLSVLTLVDLSGSTQGNVIRMERTAIVLFAEGLQVLGCPHAFLGFSGQGAEGCRIHRIKDFDDPTDDEVKKRMAHLHAGEGTRLGAYIRHASHQLERRTEDRRVLLLLSDGRPEDGDAYRGHIGVDDTALAVRAARQSGIFVFCVSLDNREGADKYLKNIFGVGRYLNLESPDQLPARLPEVFRDFVR